MRQAVRRLEREARVEHVFATVERVEGDRIVMDGGREARRAAACLLEPRPGDRVLAVERGAESYVLAVLATEEPLRLGVEGELEVRAETFRVVGKRSVEILSERAVRLLAGSLSMQAKEGDVLVERLAYTGAELVGNARVVKLVASALSSFVERFSQHLTRSYRTIEEGEQLRAKRVDYRTEEETTLRARHAFVHAGEIVKVTGAQIHMG